MCSHEEYHGVFGVCAGGQGLELERKTLQSFCYLHLQAKSDCEK